MHVDVKYLPQLADETSRRYLFVAINRATRWVFIRIDKSKTAANAHRFLRDLARACPIRIRTILTDNGKEITDRLFGLRKRAATGKHEFDQPCGERGVEHRLAPPQQPQSGLGRKAPLQAMKDWQRIKPERFTTQPDYLTGCDTRRHSMPSMLRCLGRLRLSGTKPMLSCRPRSEHFPQHQPLGELQRSAGHQSLRQGRTVIVPAAKNSGPSMNR